MPNQAHVTSVEALESFRANLIVYMAKARSTLEEVSADVMRTRLWLQNDQRQYWETQVRRRKKELEQAQQELFSAGIAALREVRTAEQMAVRQAKEALEQAEAKLRTLKRWQQEFDTRTDPMARQLERLHTLLSHNVPLGIAYLAQAVQTLEAYAEVAPSLGTPVPAPPTEQPAIVAGGTDTTGGNT